MAMSPEDSHPSGSYLVSPTSGPSFAREVLRRNDLDADPLRQFAWWFQEACKGGETDPAAMVLATVDPDGAAQARTVSLKEVDARGFIFTSHYAGPKGRDIDAEPRVALVFYWPNAGRQVRVTGVAERLPSAESARYFEARPPAMQGTLHVYPPSQPVPNRDALTQAAKALASAHGDVLTRPAWGGYVVRPLTIEFWQGQADRLHDRFRYEARSEGWELSRLAP
ncbi:MAG: pyridoxamine 5'-phosphate oxidase [Bacteroidota bacterium]